MAAEDEVASAGGDEAGRGSAGGSGEWFRMWCFWGWQEVPDYSALVSVAPQPRACRACGVGAGAARSGRHAWLLGAADQRLPVGPQRASVLSAWRETTKRIARNKELRYGFELDGRTLEMILLLLFEPALPDEGPERVWAAQILVEVIMHTYIHDGPAARAVVSTMLLELARSPHARVVAVEIVVNASLRAQLLMDHALPLAASAHDQIVADDDAKCEQQTHCQDHEAALFIVADLRRQLLSLIGAAWQEEILDAHMSEAAVTALLLVCTCNGEFDRLVSQVLPLEALAALVSHTSSNATALHGDGMAHAALVRVLSQNLHCYTSHSRRAPITGEGGLEERGTGAQATWVACEKTGFEERLRRVGGIRFILLQLRNARSASCREQLYSIVMRYILLAVLEAHGEGSSSAEGEEGEEEEGGGDWEERDGERIVADARGLRMRAQEADEEGEWERACVEVVLQLDDYALPHALAQALWARSPNFSDLLAAHVAGRTKHHAAAAHALFAALEQVSVSFHLHDAAHWHHLGSSGEQACGRSWAPPELTSTGPGQGAGNAAAVEALAQVLLSDVCFERLSGVNDLFALHVRAPRPQGDCAAGCAWCKDCSWRLQAISAEADLPERARGDDFDSAVAGWQSGACLRGGEGDGELLGERSAADEVGAQGWVGVCILPVEQELLRKDARVGLGLLELTRKLLVHYKMSWGGCPAALRASLALRIQLLIAHRLEVIVSLVEDGTEGAMSCKCLTTLVDIILSMLTVGIPERAPHPCLGGDDRGEDLEGWQEGKREGWVKDAVDVGHGDELGAAGGEDEVGGDRLEDLVGDGTLALHLTALKVAPWSVIRYTLERLPPSHDRARQALGLVLVQASKLAPERFARSIGDLVL